MSTASSQAAVSQWEFNTWAYRLNMKGAAEPFLRDSRLFRNHETKNWGALKRREPKRNIYTLQQIISQFTQADLIIMKGRSCVQTHLSWGSWGQPSSWPSWRSRSRRRWSNVSSWRRTKPAETLHSASFTLHALTVRLWHLNTADYLKDDFFNVCNF